MPHYGMAIDTRRCIGCHTCSVACKTANNLPRGVWYNNVVMAGGATLESGTGSFPNVAMSFMPTACQHCVNPACVAVCPTGASHVADDGIVMIDVESCIGCQACM